MSEENMYAHFEKALRLGQACEIKRMLQEGKVQTDFPKKGSQLHDTPLHIAAQIGDCEVLKILLDHDADVHKTNMQGHTPLHVAIESGYMDAVKLLIYVKDTLNSQEGHTTPLFFAAELGKMEFVEVLLEAGADPNLKGSVAGNRALHAAAVTHTDRTDLIKLLLRYGADIEKMNCAGATPLSEAVLYGCTHGLKSLIRAGACVDTPTLAGGHILHWAVELSLHEHVSILLHAGASHTATNDKNQTPLHVAVLCDEVRIAETLLQAGANPCAHHNNGESCLELVTRPYFCMPYFLRMFMEYEYRTIPRVVPEAHHRPLPPYVRASPHETNGSVALQTMPPQLDRSKVSVAPDLRACWTLMANNDAIPT